MGSLKIGNESRKNNLRMIEHSSGVGTFKYAAPEVWKSYKVHEQCKYDVKSDIFSLGLIILEWIYKFRIEELPVFREILISGCRKRIHPDPPGSTRIHTDPPGSTRIHPKKFNFELRQYKFRVIFHPKIFYFYFFQQFV